MFWNLFLQEFLLRRPCMHAWDSAQSQCKILFPPLLTPTWLQLQWAERRSSSNTNKSITKELLSHIMEWLHLISLMSVHLCLFLVLCSLLHRYSWHWRCSLRKWWHMVQRSSRDQLEGKRVSLTACGWGMGSRARSLGHRTVTPGQHYLHPADRQSQGMVILPRGGVSPLLVWHNPDAKTRWFRRVIRWFHSARVI